MQINISGHHVEVTPAIRDYCLTKLDKLSRHNDLVNNAQVTLSVDKLTQKAEALVHVNGNKDIFADSESDDMYAAIDSLTDKLDRQLLKHKEKLRSHR
ncbi:ribosome hibernation-promoting factor, HPF/YfiA family [Microbulbifer agarilyticus]|uniref:Ribosome hibernation promoting factor n=1 Tax=Microbulbifer agarilyticus TaxID=260552 RepID=A0A1Q2M7C6_9GAMM|nr:ribosome-associated translation inhibitor RaiA [Microbulbifer agarilyticus]AQQ68530.1 ribosomal subunit interface protein [Microbulbifer agarilyticus]MBY6191501.1 ribosome-associated translation inhibitor RaiA [Microbulbifer agarilyticus]MCA0894206.1 ribosome-associated translation inhibitor RaiA [Microbulbifer agarilyticus]